MTVQDKTNSMLPVTFNESMIPFDQEGEYVPHHQDASGTVHWFSVVDVANQEDYSDLSYELRYFRAAEREDGQIVHDAYPVMPVENRGSTAFPRPTLEIMLEDGDLENTQELAYLTARTYGLPFPDPADLPDLNPKAEYYFGMGVSDEGSPMLEGVKTWMEGSQRRFDTFTIGEYGMAEEVQTDARELDDLLRRDGLEAAMNLAENMAVAGGHLDPQREDGRVFFAEGGPTDPFTTQRERELAAEVAVGDEPTYDINAFSANGMTHLEALKSWGEGDYARLIIPQPDWDTAAANAQAAHDMMLDDDLQGAMTLIELVAVEQGVIDPQRDDSRLFIEGPPDPFMTIRERELAAPEMDTEPFIPITLEPDTLPTMYRETVAEAEREREANAVLEGAEWFETTFYQPERELLQPVDDTVNYAVVVQQDDPWTLELAVEKYWRTPDGHLGVASLTLETYNAEEGREQAEADRQGLLETYDARGLEGMMHQVELAAMKNGLDGSRADPRLFRDGPPDRFETLAQQLGDEPNPYWNTDTGEPSYPDAGIDLTEREPELWEMVKRPAITEDGQPLGTALYMAVHPADFEQAEESIQALEVGHFATEQAADKFMRDFRGYLVPDLLDGPELAQEVAKLEGLSGEWQTLRGQEVSDFMDSSKPTVINPADWHPYNPNAERDARIEAEGIYSDPSYPTPGDIDF